MISQIQVLKTLLQGEGKQWNIASIQKINGKKSIQITHPSGAQINATQHHKYWNLAIPRMVNTYSTRAHRIGWIPATLKIGINNPSILEDLQRALCRSGQQIVRQWTQYFFNELSLRNAKPGCWIWDVGVGEVRLLKSYQECVTQERFTLEKISAICDLNHYATIVPADEENPPTLNPALTLFIKMSESAHERIHLMHNLQHHTF